MKITNTLIHIFIKPTTEQPEQYILTTRTFFCTLETLKRYKIWFFNEKYLNYYLIYIK
mgnify:CR=1 FL=1